MITSVFVATVKVRFFTVMSKMKVDQKLTFISAALRQGSGCGWESCEELSVLMFTDVNSADVKCCRKFSYVHPLLPTTEGPALLGLVSR